MAHDIYDSIFDEFCKMCPWAAKDVKKWYPSENEMEITIELRDGSAMQYDYILKCFRSGASLKELLESRKVTNEEEWRMEFAIRLFKKMQIKGWTQEDLAWDTNISQGSIAKYVNGITTPSAYNVWKMARVMNCPITDLVDF